MEIVPCALCGTEYDSRRRFCPRCGEPRDADGAAAGGTGRQANGRRARIVGVVTGLAFVAVLAALAVPRRPVAAPSLAPAPAAVVRPGPTVPDDRVDPATIPPSERAFLDECAKGQVAFNAGQFDDALAEFVKAFDHNPRNAHAANSTGQTLVRLGRPGDAVAYLQQAVALAPNRGDFQFNLARALSQEGRWTDAATAYGRAADLKPDHYPTAFNHAQALEKAGNDEAALSEYQRGTQLAPLEPSFRLAIGSLAERMGRWEDSQQAYQQYLELAPDGGESVKVKQHLVQVSARLSVGGEGGSSPVPARE
jgi:tetratricopeptide (TPR) repeat protein